MREMKAMKEMKEKKEEVKEVKVSGNKLHVEVKEVDVKHADVKTEKKEEVKRGEGKLKTTASDLSTVGTNIAALAADYGVGPVPRSAYTAKALKDANRVLNRMKNQKQGT